MATKLGYCRFNVDENLNVQYLTSVAPQNESLEFPKADTVMRSFGRQGAYLLMRMSIAGIVQARHLDFGRSTAGYQEYLKAFEKLTVKDVETLIANCPSLQAIIDKQKLNDPNYLQDVIAARGDELGMELVGSEDFSSKKLAAYVLVVKAHSPADMPDGGWLTLLDTEFHAEVNVTADDLHSALGPKFDQALAAVVIDVYDDELKSEIKSTLEQHTFFKYMLSSN